MEPYDLLVIGGGPAGLSAAVNGRRRNKRVLLVGKETVSNKLRQAHRVDNYLGLPEISGVELAAKYRKHAVAEGVDLLEDEIQNLWAEEDVFQAMGKTQLYVAKTVIMATGTPQKVSLPGEEELAGKGVSYCATCDGMFFRGKKVFVLSELEEGEKEANFLADLCTEVYYLPRYQGEYKGLDPRIKVVSGRVLRLLGEEKLTGVETSTGRYEVDGVFIERVSLPLDRLLPDLALENGFIQVDRRQRTNVPGVFAAGDCTGKPWQIAKAVGEGLVAALSAVDYLANRA
ncbi:MAG TPA: NAD(P)/FAD-dependent oxidoreductase [Firmicutes bacterium]|jgi:thioredoxin reductase (NADPH)|nr:NAD(P)/FAD-dependent oxidoreductase [Bacillota bacterium]